MHGLMVGRWEDDACVLATTAAAARLLAQPASRAALLAHPEVAARCAELLHHPAREVRLVGQWAWRCGGPGGWGRLPRFKVKTAPLTATMACPSPRPQVARAADAALDAVAAGSEEWAASVRRLKFEAHNREWLSLVQAELAEEAAAEAAAGGAAPAHSAAPEAAGGGPAIGAYWGGGAAAQPPAVDA